ncbi:MAG TPA: hypothetical protein VFE32_00240 [Puia sp.]|jgi:hypothetical protein|nr:hypothetical protein [Puia sp.]
MRYEYVVILKKDGQRATDLLSILLCFCSAVIFGYTQLKSDYPNYYLYLFTVLILAGLLYDVLIRRRQHRPVRYKYLILLTALGWFGMPFLPWIGILFIVLAFLEHQAKRPLEIGFDRDRVVINTLIRQRHDWSVFNNVLLRDGLLTLDFKNNRLLQKEVADDDDEDDADEEEFNAWCRDRLAGSSATPA